MRIIRTLRLLARVHKRSQRMHQRVLSVPSVNSSDIELVERERARVRFQNSEEKRHSTFGHKADAAGRDFGFTGLRFVGSLYEVSQKKEMILLTTACPVECLTLLNRGQLATDYWIR